MNASADNRLRMGAALGMAGLIVLTAGGCQGGSTSGSAGSGAASTATGAKMLMGTKLNSLLLPASAMPKGFRLNADGARNTGDSVSPRSSSPVPPGKVCDMLLQTSWSQAAGIDAATFAQNDYGDSSHTNQFAQEIDTYHGDDAQKTMSGLRKAFAHCAAFTDKTNGMTAKVKLVRSALRGAGDEGVKAVATSSLWQGGLTLVGVRVGNAVITTLYSSSHQDKGAAAVKMAETLAKKVRSAS
ncbi:MAG: hypothetical protein JWL58_71 [Streptosporangiaceae bacterium]|jgi:glycine/D-amino acid oxidase-like deaminating enzyme|nr:hypothetical protein [Streptosporangiaceae bacterium]